ncbi:hypothetical protein [Leptospira kemamanensis]|uniref:hypothetical protein n=1 Tax=Leptospira kemamanensis TaxID=2484942 RepID=UPI0010827FA0|nr:hypothetical protein [Leptospira kemamanensis]
MLHRKTDSIARISGLPRANDREMTKSNITIHKDKQGNFTTVTDHFERKTYKLSEWNRKHETKNPQPWVKAHIVDEI